MRADEFAVELEADPEYRAIQARWDEAEQRLKDAETPLVADLKEAGAPVRDSVYDLVNTSKPYPEALPVLMEHLERGGYPARIMEGIGRALSVRDSVVYWDRLIERYLNPRCEGELTGIALALSACMDKAHVDDVIELLTDDTQGEVRVFFVKTLGKHGGERGRRVIESLVDDPVVGKEATAFVTRARKRAEKKARKT